MKILNFLCCKFSNSKHVDILEKKSPGINTLLLSLKDSCDITTGFFVKNQNEIIKWDDSYKEICERVECEVEFDEYKSMFIVFTSPVILGCFMICDFKLRYPDFRFQKDDMPIESIWSKLKISQKGGFADYFIAKKSLSKLVGDPSPVYEPDNSKISHWKINGINISISSQKDEPVFLRIENARDYKCLISQFNVAEIIPNELISFYKKGFIIRDDDFRGNKNLYKTPECIKSNFIKGLVSQIWIDNSNKLIGFSTREYSVIFNQEDIKEILLQNILPAKGGGGSYIFINTHESAYLINVSIIGDLYLFDKYVDDLKKIIGAKFKVSEPLYDV